MHVVQSIGEAIGEELVTRLAKSRLSAFLVDLQVELCLFVDRLGCHRALSFRLFRCLNQTIVSNNLDFAERPKG